MLRKSKYDMIQMDAATKIVIDKAQARVPLGLLQVDVKGTFKSSTYTLKTLSLGWSWPKM